MELKEATYKTTELGLIPEDWSITTLSKVGSFSKGKGIKKDEVQTDGIPCVRYGELYTKYDNIITFFHSYISEEVAASSIQIKEGDILFAGSGETREEIGKCAAMLYEDRVYAGGDIVVLRPNNFDSTFLGYLLNAPIIAKQKSVKGQGDAVVHIYSSGLANVKIPVPPPDEQKAIATALSDVDTLITNLDKLIAKKKAIKQGAMQRLLKSPAQGGQRLPGFKGEWVIEKLQKLTRQIIDGTHHTPRYTTRGIPFLRVTDIQTSSIDMTDLKYVSKEEHETLIKRCNPEKGDILLSKNGTIGIPKVVDWDWEFSVFVSLALIKIKDHLLDVSYLSHYLSSEFMKQQIKERSKQGTVTNLHLEEIREFDIPVPPTLEEQRAIDTILTDMTNDINSLENKKLKYLYIKQGMMQELLTGKTRLV